ncbi:hypothetical protein P3S67_016655 [Capsicum chacoense]
MDNSPHCSAHNLLFLFPILTMACIRCRIAREQRESNRRRGHVEMGSTAPGLRDGNMVVSASTTADVGTYQGCCCGGGGFDGGGGGSCGGD